MSEESAIRCYSFYEARNVAINKAYKISLITEDFFEMVKRQSKDIGKCRNALPNFSMWGIFVFQPVVKLH